MRFDTGTVQTELEAPRTWYERH